ncbi:hypothetical protein [Roseobacter sp. N2S]|uniref:hypothetical protein n=1 Tax=Roseobacter sp. N2S TaxID=2663844 RepID=UPI002861C385|nr:hypothetical protein [Roseobacter sp. N2S]MDR6267668.1 hypothetical protein [Roseobacter sp. N2S]
MPNLKQSSATLGLVCGLLVVSGVARAQDAEPIILSFNLGSKLRVDDNFGLDSPSAGTATFLTHHLGFDLSTRSQNQTLDFGASADFRQGNIPGNTVSTGSDNEHIYLDYTRENANNRLAAGAFYKSSDVSSTFLLANPDLPFSSDLIVDRGTLGTYGSDVSLDLGTNAPFGVTLRGGYTKREYQNTTNASLFDSDNSSLSATGNLRFSATLTGTIEAGWNRYTAQDVEQTDRETTRFGIGLQGEINPILSFVTSISHNQINTDETVGGLRGSTKDNGWSGSFELTRQMQNGTATVDLSNSFSTNGNRVSLVFGRSLELPRGALSATLGASKGDGGTPNAIGSLEYSLETATSVFTASLSRSFQTSSDDDEYERTKAAVGYKYQINSVAGLNLSLDYAQIEGLDATTVTGATRSNLRISYDRELPADWVLSGGYEARYADSDTTNSARSNAVFLSLDKSFKYKP